MSTEPMRDIAVGESETDKTEKKLQKYLFFSLDAVEYGVDISLVQEIITLPQISPIPSTKKFCKGVINIRGSIVPVIDMRIKLGKEPCEYTESTCIIVLELAGERIGAIVEKVLEVVEIASTQLLDSPAKTETTGFRSISSKILGSAGGKRQILDLYQVFDLEPES